MPSFTTWSRIEPQPTPTGPESSVESGYAARVYDPLWLLARQWQVGEFQGEDAGTPVVARWRARVAPMSRFVAGPIPPDTQLDAPRFDPARVPLETLVERQVVGFDGLRRAVEAGLHFLRLLRVQHVSHDPGPAFVATYPVRPLSADERERSDPETLAYADLVAGRALDGRRLRAALDDPAAPHLDASLGIHPEDRAEVVEAYRQWVLSCDSLFSEPAPDQANRTWQPDRMEYSFSLATRVGDDVFGGRTLTAQQYADGALDWYSFDLNGDVTLGTGQDPPGEVVTRTVVPAPVTYHGMPAPRFWELEDARIDLGALRPGATDLAQMLLVETLTGYGNDWYVIPVELPVGSLVESRSLVVTDTFGFRSLLRPTGDSRVAPRGGFSMFSQAMPVEPGDATGVAVSNLFFLSPRIETLDGPVLEELMLVRDELANIAWAVERRLESPLEVGVETARDVLDLATAPAAAGDSPVYRLASPRPAHWVPLLPVRVSAGSAEIRLARGAVLDLDGVPRVVHAEARLLDAGGGRLLIREEEVPREGVVVRRMYQAARWYDGRLFVWSGNRATIGRGEASSGLAFDEVQG